jgi:3-oxoacyl-[acyl-carrier protein] reductase
MEKLLSGKTCIVTGGSKGIGRAIVELFAREGARVYYLSRSEAEDPAALSAAAAAGGGSAKWISCDVADEARVNAAVDAIVAEAGAIDALVNNAGVTRDGLVFRMSLEDWDTVLRTNLTSAFLVSREVARLMIKRRSGSIVNVSSVVGITGNGGQTNYSASKAGLIGFTKSLAKEVGGRNITVNAVAPGFIPTDLTNEILGKIQEDAIKATPLGRLGTVEDVAQAVAFLASDEASFITGQVLSVDGGMVMQ